MAVKGAESDEIVQALIKQHPDAIARENADLVHIALMKLVGQVGSTRVAGSTAAQLEMFSEYAVPKTILVHAEDGRRVHRLVQSMTPVAVRDYIEEHTKPRSRRQTGEVKELIRLVDDIEPYKKTDKSTVGECWTAFQKAQGG